jgi:hypothetical protein
MATGSHPRHVLTGPKGSIPVRTARDARKMQDRCCKRPGTRKDKRWVSIRDHVPV